MFEYYAFGCCQNRKSGNWKVIIQPAAHQFSTIFRIVVVEWRTQQKKTKGNFPVE